ncbi:MAG: ParA family protein [Rhodothalassiaceae bacterium]
MKTLALYNIKGGVGKTSAAVNLAYEAVRDGGRVLLWDLDPQGATSFYLRIKAKLKGGDKTILERDRPIEDLVKESDYPGLDLLPADFSYRRLDAALATQGKAKGLKKFLKPMKQDYDLVFLDCPPSISHLSENVFQAADALIVPLLPSPLSLRTYDQIATFCADQRITTPRLPFFSMVDRRKALHRQIVAEFPQQHAEVLPTAIPYASIVERMGVERAPLATYAPKCAAAVAFASLWQDIAERLGG